MRVAYMHSYRWEYIIASNNVSCVTNIDYVLSKSRLTFIDISTYGHMWASVEYTSCATCPELVQAIETHVQFYFQWCRTPTIFQPNWNLKPPLYKVCPQIPVAPTSVEFVMHFDCSSLGHNYKNVKDVHLYGRVEWTSVWIAKFNPNMKCSVNHTIYQFQLNLPQNVT